MLGSRATWAAWAAAGLAGLGAVAPAGAQDDAQEKEKTREMEMKAIKERLEFLEGKTKGFPDPAGQSPPVGTFFKDGLKWKSADGNFDGYLGGRLLVHARFIHDRQDGPAAGPAESAPDTFFVRQGRIETGGTFYKIYEYKVQADFPTPGASGTLQDAYLGITFAPAFALRIGQFKEPFSQEETTSTRFIDFVERSIVNRLAPARDIGLMLHGAFSEGVFEYEVGLFNGAGRAAADTNDEKDVAARVRGTPWKTSEDPWLKNLRVGVAGTVGDQDGPAFADVTSTETGVRIVDFDGTALNDGDRTRKGVELSWLVHNWGARAEYVRTDFDAVEGAVDDGIDATGYYVAVTYLLSGEDKTLENRIKPKEPFDPAKGAWGAWELAARVANLDYNDVFGQNFGATGTGGNDRTTGTTLGVNWYLTSNFRCSLNWVHYTFSDDVLFGAGNDKDSEDAVLARWQVDF